MNNPYFTLGVDPSVTAEELKVIWRKLAQQLHPDREGGDEQKFKEAKAAYELLSDPKARARYDNTGCADDGHSITNEAEANLSAMIVQMVDNASDVSRSNLIDAMRNQVVVGQQRVKDEQSKLKRSAGKRRNAMNRLKRKGDGHDFMVAALQRAIDEDNLKGDALARHLAVFNEMIGMLNQYKYEVDVASASDVGSAPDMFAQSIFRASPFRFTGA